MSSNYTKIPNVLLDEYMASVDSFSELKVVMVIARKTIGWQKKEDKMSLSQLIKDTGLSRQGVIDGVNSAIKNGVLHREQAGQSFLYRLNIDGVKTIKQPELVNKVDHLKSELVNEVDQSTELTSQQSRPDTVNELDQLDGKLVNKVDTQKKEQIKEKEITTSSSGDLENEKPVKNEIDEEWQKVVEAYESNIGVFTAMSSEMVRSAFDDYGSVLVVDAIKAAVSQNVRKWSYVDGILKRWKADGKKAPKPAKVEEKQKTIVIFNQYTNQREVKVIQ